MRRRQTAAFRLLIVSGPSLQKATTPSLPRRQQATMTTPRLVTSRRPRPLSSPTGRPRPLFPPTGRPRSFHAANGLPHPLSPPTGRPHSFLAANGRPHSFCRCQHGGHPPSFPSTGVQALSKRAATPSLVANRAATPPPRCQQAATTLPRRQRAVTYHRPPLCLHVATRPYHPRSLDQTDPCFVLIGVSVDKDLFSHKTSNQSSKTVNVNSTPLLSRLYNWFYCFAEPTVWTPTLYQK